jgi:titin
VVENNLITRGNFGVLISNGASGNTVGGTEPSARNVISAVYYGVWITDASTIGNAVLGNYIGANPATGALGNAAGVVLTEGASGNTVGPGDVISGNYLGVMLYAASGNTVAGERIGTDSSGTAAVPNCYGVVIEAGATGNTVGGTTDAARNLISGNSVLFFTDEPDYPSAGVLITGAGTSANVVEGNRIGTDLGGTARLPNFLGVCITKGATGNTVGGTTAAARNLISGNWAGVWVSDDGTAGNLVEGDYVGTDPGGADAVPNAAGVVLTEGASGNTVGPGDVISGNYLGVMLYGAGTSGNVVQGDYIGTGPTGSSAVPNDYGVVVEAGASLNTVGGITAVARNIISGNTGVGVWLTGGGTARNLVEGDDIGSQADGATPLANGSHGVFVSDGASGNTVGGIAAGAGDIIAFNGGNGVLIGADPALIAGEAGAGNAVLGDSIFGNARLGIDLGDNDGVTPNGFNGNVGPNDYQNYSVLTSATVTGGTTTVQGSLQSAPNTTFRVEFFANVTADPSGHGQGQTFLGFADVTTDGSGLAAISAMLPVAVPLGQAISATATAPGGSTSELSADVTAQAPA